MNSFENNTPLPTELHPGADRAMDGLLQELANNNISDDEAFLSGLESALDQASGTPTAQPIAVRSTGQRWWRWGLLGSAAACAVGMLAWRDSQLKQLAKNKSDQPREASPSVEPKADAVALQSPSVALDFTELDALTLFNTDSDSNSLLPLKRRSGLGSEISSFGRDAMNFAQFWGEIEPNYQIGSGTNRRLPSAADSFFGTFDQYQLGISPPWLKPRTYQVTIGFGQRITPAASDGFAEGIQLTADAGGKTPQGPNSDVLQNGATIAEAPPSLSAAEINKRLQRVADSKKIEVEGDERFASGDYAAALEKFDAAFSLLPNGSATAEDRGRMVSKFSNACIKQADKLGKLARIDDAKALLKRVLDPGIDPINAAAKTLLKRLDDPDYYNAALTESAYKDPNGVPSLMRQGIGYSDLGQYGAAEETFNKVLAIDPNNTRARARLEEIEKEIDAHLASARDPSRARMLRNVDETGNPATPSSASVSKSGTGTLNLSGGLQATPGSGQGIRGTENRNLAVSGSGFGLGVSGGGGTGGRGAVSGSVRRRMVVPENGLGYVGNNGTTGDYREANLSDPVSNGEKYSSAIENAFLSPLKAPLSTFSVDVDTASYANLRRMIQSGQNVPPAAVRIEEMVNYFTYSYPQLEGPHPFSVQVESAACPWNEAHRLVKIGLKAKEIAREKRPSANLVFLCDVSGSMNSADKLPLLVQNLTVLTNELNADDTVGIVVYAGSEGVALPPTSGGDKQTILRALTNLSAGGSTNGGAGINRAYQMAQERFIKGGINRVVLCTDGDFNVGTTSKEALVNLVEEKAKGGVFLTVCGYGQGNLNDSMMEAITNKGNGVYHYVDSEKEGKKIFKDELFGTLMTVAKDVKLQVEFNPAKVGQYRLVGYDNRMLKKEDFANDKVDAGDIGAGHTVTALYEIVPPEVAAKENPPDALKYQSNISKMDSLTSSEMPVVSKDGEWVIRKYPDGHFTKTKADLENKQMTREDYDSEKVLTKTTLFNIDDKRRLKNGLVKDPDGTPTGTMEFGYNKNNEINEKRLYNAKGELVQRVFPPGSLNIPQNEKSAISFTYSRDDLDMMPILNDKNEQNGVGKAEDDTFQPGLPILRWEKGPSPEMLTVKLRYKEPEGTESKLLEVPHTDAGQPLAAASSDFKFASAVAEFGEWIRGKRVAGRSPLQMAEQAESARGNDPHGLRGEFIELVNKAASQRQ